MKIVIEIPEKTYQKIIAGTYDYGDMNVIIQNGTPYEERPQWILCSERLPEPDKDVLVCSDEGYIEVAEGYISTEIEEFVWLTSGWRFGKVIAWMPLPTPYREAGGKE